MLNDAERRAVKLAYLIWKNIDFENMKRSRLLGIWNEFEGKLQFAAYNGQERFLEVICRKMGIGVPKFPELLMLIDKESIEAIKRNSKKIVTMLRKMIEVEKERIKTTEEKKALKEYVDNLISELERKFDESIGGGVKA